MTDTPDAGGAPDPRLLEELDEHIREARAAAEKALAGSGHRFAEPGDDPGTGEDDPPPAR